MAFLGRMLAEERLKSQWGREPIKEFLPVSAKKEIAAIEKAKYPSKPYIAPPVAKTGTTIAELEAKLGVAETKKFLVDTLKTLNIAGVSEMGNKVSENILDYYNIDPAKSSAADILSKLQQKQEDIRKSPEEKRKWFRVGQTSEGYKADVGKDVESLMTKLQSDIDKYYTAKTTGVTTSVTTEPEIPGAILPGGQIIPGTGGAVTTTPTVTDLTPSANDPDVKTIAKQKEAEGETPSDAVNDAIEIVKRQREQEALLKAEEEAKETEIQGFLTAFPEQARLSREALAGELAKYQTGLWEERLQPAIYQGMARRGLTGEQGALNVALARESGRLASEREATLAPMVRADTLAAQQLAYENMLRQAQKTGQRGTSLTEYGRQQRGLAGATAYDYAKTSLSQSLAKTLAELGYQQQLGLLGKQYEYAGRQQEEAGLGSLAGLLASVGLGAGAGAVLPGITAGQGAMLGFGRYPYKWYE